MKLINKIKSVLDKIDILKPENSNNIIISNNKTYPEHINSFIIGRTSFTLIEYHPFLQETYNELVSLFIKNNLNFKWFRTFEEFIEYYYICDYDDGYYFILIG